MKNTVALAHGDSVVLSPHIGDLATLASQQAFERHIECLVSLLRTHPRAIACDAHPDYDSTRYARASGLPVVTVQHHLAHALACLLEGGDANPTTSSPSSGMAPASVATAPSGAASSSTSTAAPAPPAAWPASGPSGSPAPRPPSATRAAARSACSTNSTCPIPKSCNARPRASVLPGETGTFLALLAQGLNAPQTSAAGRLFDGVAALLELARRNTFEGQAPMQLEFAAERAVADGSAHAFPIVSVRHADGRERLEIDWRPALGELLAGRTSLDAATLAGRFHRGLCAAIAEVARAVGIGAVALSGGCFQNRFLLEGTHRRLLSTGFTVLRHRELPPNDGNIAAGQALAVRLGITEVEP
jgi:hydrogenase maturation protein HypF